MDISRLLSSLALGCLMAGCLTNDGRYRPEFCNQSFDWNDAYGEATSAMYMPPSDVTLSIQDHDHSNDSYSWIAFDLDNQAVRTMNNGKFDERVATHVLTLTSTFEPMALARNHDPAAAPKGLLDGLRTRPGLLSDLEFKDYEHTCNEGGLQFTYKAEGRVALLEVDPATHLPRRGFDRNEDATVMTSWSMAFVPVALPQSMALKEGLEPAPRRAPIWELEATGEVSSETSFEFSAIVRHAEWVSMQDLAVKFLNGTTAMGEPVGFSESPWALGDVQSFEFIDHDLNTLLSPGDRAVVRYPAGWRVEFWDEWSNQQLDLVRLE